MKFQDSSFTGLKITIGTKSVTHPRTHPLTDAPKAICPIYFFKVGGILILWETQGMAQPNNTAYPKHQWEEEIPSNRNHTKTSNQQQKNQLSCPQTRK